MNPLVVAGVLFLLAASSDNMSTMTEAELKLCIINKVKETGLLGDDFGTDEPVSDVCVSTYEKLRPDNMRMIAKVLSDSGDYEQYSIDCIMDKLEKTKIVETFLAIKAASEEDPDKEDDELLIFLKSKFNVTVETASEFCRDSTFSDDGFAGFFFTNNLTIYDEPRKDVCVRRFIANNHLITLPGISLNLNPNKIEISSSECVQLMQEHFVIYTARMAVDSHIYRIIARSEPTRLTEKFKECVNDVIRAQNFVEKFMPIQYLSAMYYGDEQREQLKVVINEMFREYFDKTFACDDIE